MKTKTALATLFSGLVIGLSSPAISAAEYEWDLASEFNSTSIHGEGDLLFKKLVEEKTKGQVKITPHFSGSLGFRSKDQLDAVADGAVPIADTFTGTLGGIHPVFSVSALPFITQDFQDARDLFDASRGWYEEVLLDNNQVLLWASPWPSAGIWAKKPVTTQADLNDLKIRTYDALGATTLKQAGATAVQLGWSDVIPQLSTGGIEAVLTSAEAGLSVKFPQLLDHYMPINYGTPLNMVSMNLDTWSDLPKDIQQAVREAANEVMERQWSEVTERQARNFERARKEKVTVVTGIDPAFRSHVSQSGQAATEGWLEKAGTKGQKVLEAYKAKVAARQ